MVIAAIIYWNSTYLADAAAHLAGRGEPSTAMLAHTLPLTWEHIGFSGDFLWDRAAATAGRRRALNLSAITPPHDQVHHTFTHRVVFLTTNALPSTTARPACPV